MRPWFHRLLKADISPDFRASLPAFLKQEARTFNQAAPLSEAKRDVLTHWYFSPRGQEQLEGLLDAIWRQMDSVAQWAMPAHDARHAMYKVPASALLYMHSEDVRNIGRLGIFGALLHDHGRWAEERIFGGPGESMVHARLSFLLARELVEEFRLPEQAARLILQAVVQHTAGAVPADDMAVKLTVAADRDQLYGPEIIIRILHHVVRDEALASVYGEKPGSTVLDRLSHFLFNRHPGPLFSRETHVNSLQNVLAKFLLMAEPAAQSQVRFAARPVTGTTRRLLPADFEWELAYAQAQAELPSADDPVAALRTLLSAPNLVANPAYLNQALDKLSNLPAEHRSRLAGALTWVHAQRQRYDLQEAVELQRLKLTYSCDRPVAELLHRVLPAKAKDTALHPTSR